jgi:translation initiation factor 1
MGRKKNRWGTVYSTDPDFDYDQYAEEEETLPPGEQTLYVSLDRKQRKGRTVTLVEGFTGTSDDLRALEKQLKTQCGVGGSSGDGCILLQGDLKQKVAGLLERAGYRIKLKG